MKVSPGGSSKCFFLKSFFWNRTGRGRRMIFTLWFKSHRNAHVRPCQKNGPPFIFILPGRSTPSPSVAVWPCHLPAQPALCSCPTSRVRAGDPVVRGESSRLNWAQTRRRADGPRGTPWAQRLPEALAQFGQVQWSGVSRPIPLGHLGGKSTKQ